MGHLYYRGNHSEASMGAHGHTEVDSGDSATAAGVIYCGIQAFENCTITCTDNPQNASGQTTIDVAVLAGQVIMGRFSEITTTGLIWAYFEKGA